MREILLLSVFACLASAACFEGGVSESRCLSGGVLSYRECVSGAFVQRSLDCAAQGKACSVESLGCIPAQNCTSDVFRSCTDGSQVMTASCLNRTALMGALLQSFSIAQPTGWTCSGCVPGYPCESKENPLLIPNASFKVKVSLQELDVSGSPAKYIVKELEPGQNASVRGLNVTLLKVTARISCESESRFSADSEQATFEVSWGPVKSNVTLSEGGVSPRYCAEYPPAPPCAEVDVNFAIPLNGISSKVSCLAPPPAPTPTPTAPPPECSGSEARCKDNQTREYCESGQWAEENCSYLCENSYCLSVPLPPPNASQGSAQNQSALQNQTLPLPQNPPGQPPSAGSEAPSKCLGIFLVSALSCLVFAGKRWI